MITTLVLSACLSAQIIVIEPLTPFPSVAEAKEKALVPQDGEPGLKRVREVAGDLAAAKTPNEKLDQAIRLVTLGQDAKEEAGPRWAALTEALRLATEANNLLVAFWIIDAQDRLFEINITQHRLDLLRKVAQVTPLAPQMSQAAAKGALIAGRDAEQLAKTPEDYDAVQSLAELAVDFATKAKDSVTREAAQKFRDNVKVYRKEFEDAQAAKSKLASAADDVEANRTWGKHLALNRLDWENGLPFLAKGDGPLAEAARADQGPKPERPEDLEAAGNRWTKLADADKKLLARETAALRSRAAEWYRQSLKRMNTAGRARVEAKLKNIPPAPPSLPKPFDPAALSPGLMVQTYPRHAQQRGANKFVPFDQLGEPLGKPTTTRTLETFTYPADANLAAFGYLKVENLGSFYFHVPNHQPVLILLDGRPVLPMKGVGVTFQLNRKGYVPLAIFGFVDTREIHLEWLTEGGPRLPVPQLFHDPERLKP